MLEGSRSRQEAKSLGPGEWEREGREQGRQVSGGRLPRDLWAFTCMRWSHRKVLSGEGWSLTQVFTGSVWQGGAWTLEVGQDWEEEELRVQGQRGQTGPYRWRVAEGEEVCRLQAARKVEMAGPAEDGHHC